MALIRVDFGCYPLQLDHNFNLFLKGQFGQLAAALTLFFENLFGRFIHFLRLPRASSAYLSGRIFGRRDKRHIQVINQDRLNIIK